MVPGSEVVGRISLVFQKYLFDLPLIPLSGKVLGHVRCNELLNYCVQKELLPHFTSSHQFMTHYELCAKLILVSQSLSCLKPGGYLKTDGFGYAPSLKSVYSAMTVQEKEATIPGLTLGEILPESFHIPYGSFDSLWTLGFHRRMMGTTVHSNSIDGLRSIAIRKEKIHICDTCPLPLPFPESHLKNFLCQNGCCAAIRLSQKDQKDEAIQKFSIEPKHFIYLYIVHPNSETTAQRVKSFFVFESSILKLNLFQAPKVFSYGENCTGVERNFLLVSHASSFFPNGIIVRSYQNKTKMRETTLVGHVARGIIQYVQCNKSVLLGKKLCKNCLGHQKWLKSLLYESNCLKQKQLCNNVLSPSRKLFARRCITDPMERTHLNCVFKMKKKCLLEVKQSYKMLLSQHKYLLSTTSQKDAVNVQEPEEDAMLFLLKEVLNNFGDKWKKSFSYTFMYQQLEALTKDPRGMRWNPDVVNFFSTISYYGGKKVYNILQGKAFEGQGKSGKLVMNASSFNLHIPSLTVLKRQMPKVDPYGSRELVPSCCKSIWKMFTCLIIWENQIFKGGLVFDEIEIQHGLIYLKKSGILVGLASGPLLVESLTGSDADYKDLIAQKVCQCFFVSNCGKICIPLHYFPTVSLSAKDLFSVTEYLKQCLIAEQIHVVWTSTDGFKGSLDYIQKKSSVCKSSHFFDYVHMVKLGRNQLLN